MKKNIDIEKLLQWALIEELPKGRPVSADIGYVIGRSHSRRPFSVAQSSSLPSVDQLGFVPGAPHEDALRISDAIGELDDVARFEDVVHARKMFGEHVGIAGAAIDKLARTSFNPRALVISFAIKGQRPNWKFASPLPYERKEQFRDAAGAARARTLVQGLDESGAMITLKANRGRKAMRDGLYDLDNEPRCPLVWDNPSPLTVGLARAEYFAWHAALILLADQLQGKLAEYHPCLPAAPAMPWITGEQKLSRVLSDGLPDGLLTQTLPLAPKRKAPGRPSEPEIITKSRPRPHVLKLARAIKADARRVSV